MPVLSCPWLNNDILNIYHTLVTCWSRLVISLQPSAHRMEQEALRMGRLAGSLAYWCLKLFLLMLIKGPGFSSTSAGGEDSGTVFAWGTSSLAPLLFLVFLAFSFSWGSVETAGVSVAASGGGRVSRGRSLGLGFRSACSSLPGMLRLDPMRLALVLVELVQLQISRVSQWFTKDINHCLKLYNQTFLHLAPGMTVVKTLGSEIGFIPALQSCFLQTSKCICPRTEVILFVTVCGTVALMHRNMEVLWLRKCSAKGKGCLTSR